MTSWKGKTANLNLSFLDKGEYKSLLATDGVNADRHPSDYTITHGRADNSTTMKITMAKGGGFVLVLKKP